MSNYKTCAVCKEELPLDCFSVNRAVPDGLQRKCRQCDNEYQTTRRERAGYRESQTEYYLRRHEELKDDLEYRCRKLLNASRARAKKRGIEHTLTLDELLSVFPEDMICPVLNIEMRWNDRGMQDSSPSIDKVDPEKGYTLDNIQVMSFRANRIKTDATLDELVALVSYLGG